MVFVSEVYPAGRVDNYGGNFSEVSRSDWVFFFFFFFGSFFSLYPRPKLNFLSFPIRSRFNDKEPVSLLDLQAMDGRVKHMNIVSAAAGTYFQHKGSIFSLLFFPSSLFPFPFSLFPFPFSLSVFVFPFG